MEGERNDHTVWVIRAWTSNHNTGFYSVSPCAFTSDVIQYTSQSDVYLGGQPFIQTGLRDGNGCLGCGKGHVENSQQWYDYGHVVV